MILKLAAEILVGAHVGTVAGKIMNTRYSFIVDIILGIVGGAIGGYLGGLIGIGDGWISGLILAVVGSCLVIWFVKKLK